MSEAAIRSAIMPKAAESHRTGNGLLDEHEGRLPVDLDVRPELAGRVLVEVGATSHVDSGNRSDCTTTAERLRRCSWRFAMPRCLEQVAVNTHAASACQRELHASARGGPGDNERRYLPDVGVAPRFVR
jgi:hypothetical protein